jgi:hypothetical protein
VTYTPPLGSPALPQPRAFNLRQGAAYLGVSYWTLRDYVLAGLIPTIEMPALRPRDGERQRSNLRRVLVDREDLDRFLESRKVGAAPDMQSRVRGESPSARTANVPTLHPKFLTAGASR